MVVLLATTNMEITSRTKMTMKLHMEEMTMVKNFQEEKTINIFIFFSFYLITSMHYNILLCKLS